MITDQGCRVVEFNARFGDPETQVVLPLLDGDLGEIMLACAQGKLDASMVNWKNSYATCVIMASKGYPETSSKNDVINGDLSTTDNSMIFHSGTKLDGDHFVTNGGRVLGVVGLGESLQEALDVSYARVNGITFDGMQFRKDIGQKAFKHLK